MNSPRASRRARFWGSPMVGAGLFFSRHHASLPSTVCLAAGEQGERTACSTIEQGGWCFGANVDSGVEQAVSRLLCFPPNANRLVFFRPPHLDEFQRRTAIVGIASGVAGRIRSAEKVV